MTVLTNSARLCSGRSGKGPPASGRPGAPALLLAGARRPAAAGEITDRRLSDEHPLGPQQRPLHLDVPSEPADPSRCGNHTVTRHIARATVAHDVPHRPRRPRRAGRLRHVAVRGHAPRRDPADDGDDAGGEGGGQCWFRVRGSGFRVQVQGSGFRVRGSGFRVQGSGFRGSGFGVRGSGFRGSVFRVRSLEPATGEVLLSS
jgi:hypothetical protein